jgi:Na+/H+-translocating membrane pyrophosphatase
MHAQVIANGIAESLGAMTVFFFTSLTIRAVGKAAGVIVEEVRRQFREKKGIMAGTEDPDYAAAVDIATKSALREMILPGIVAVVAPVVVGLAFGKEAVAGLLMVGTIVGVLMAAYLNNAGGAWDNAKKYIEMGAHGGFKAARTTATASMTKSGIGNYRNIIKGSKTDASLSPTPKGLAPQGSAKRDSQLAAQGYKKF